MTEEMEHNKGGRVDLTVDCRPGHISSLFLPGRNAGGGTTERLKRDLVRGLEREKANTFASHKNFLFTTRPKPITPKQCAE